MDSVLLFVKSPPPVSPAPAVMVILLHAAPIPDRAAAAVFPPVPPLVTSNGEVSPDIVPPVIATALAFCEAIVPVALKTNAVVAI